MNELTVSYLTMRKMIGITGMLLFIIVALGGLFSGIPIQDSISAYYWTNSQDMLVGVLFIASAYLFAYKGYDKMDRALSLTAGVAAIGIAIFPCYPCGFAQSPAGYFQLAGGTTQILHILSSLSFFVALGVMSLFQFTKGSDEVRNKIYRACGFMIFGSIVVLLITNIIFSTAFLEALKITYVLEAVMLFAFGISWLTKGKTLSLLQ